MIWGVLGLIVAGVWVVVWPADASANASDLSHFVLRWFHAIVWFLLAAAAFAASSERGVGAARTLAYLSLATYVVFLAVMLTAT